MQRTKAGKRSLVIILVVALVAISGYVFYRVKKGDFLSGKLQGLIAEKTNQLYKVTYDSIWVNEVDGNLFIKNLHVKGDTTLQQKMLNSNDTNAVKLLLDIFIPELKVVDFKTARALLSKQLDCNQVIITNPQITMYLYPGQSKPKNARKQQEELYKQILGNFTLIKADSISIINSRVVAQDFHTKEIKFRTINTSIGLTNVAIDSTYNQDTTRTLFCKEIKLTSEKVILGDKNKTAEITGASFDTRTEVVTLAKFEYDAFKNNGFFKSALEGVSLRGITWTGPVENSDLAIEEAVLDKGELETLSTGGGKKKNTGNKSTLILNGWIKTFSLNTFRLKSLTYISRPADAQTKKMTVKNSSFLVKNVFLDRTSALDESLLNNAKEIEISNNLINLTSADNLYNYRFENLRANTLSKKITATAVKIIPLLNEAEFARKAKVQKDRYDVKFGNIECRNVDMGKLMKGEILIDQVALTNTSVHIFHDLSYPVDSSLKQGKMDNYPNQALYNLDLPLKINKITLNKTFLEYKERNPKSESSGKVRFSNASITVNNVSNHPPSRGEKMTVRFTSSFLDKVPVTGGFTFYSDEYKRGKFAASATVEKAFDATILSQLTQPMSLARIDKGTIQSFTFNITADTSVANGSLQMTYDGIKISVLKKKGDEYNKKGVVSFLANILVKNKNEVGSKMRTADIQLKPDKYRSFFNYVWQSIFTGLKQVLTIKI